MVYTVFLASLCVLFIKLFEIFYGLNELTEAIYFQMYLHCLWRTDESPWPIFFNVLSLFLSLFLMFFWYLFYYFCALIGQSCQQIRVNQKSCHLIMTNDFHAAVHLGVQSPSAYCALFGMVIEFWIIGCQGGIALMCVLQMVDEGKWHL